ncbi:biotin--[acetyl-CoA-carboxylase] ligase [Cnuibacter sp. UC19_7]|uniref:biotin--[acetyl-CoA-carboxylase] ligase n=1 Tax=Cnuibacter sp. UC19_7 TaxID=3350166 RepID=UPI00366F3997
MPMPLSSSLVPRLEWLERTGSTNADLVAWASGPAAADWPDLSVVATDDQTEGRGRLGRVWIAPPGRTLAVSVLVRPAPATVAPAVIGLLPLISGVAMTSVVRELVRPEDGDRPATGMKWPNDVLIGGRKVAGILGEALPDGRGAVIGAGLNLTLSDDELPTPVSTSLALEGVDELSTDAVLAAYLRELATRYHDLVAAGGDAERSGLLAAARELSATLGRRVRVELPDGAVREGTAVALDALGRLEVEETGGGRLIVSAGDITHLRHNDS